MKRETTFHKATLAEYKKARAAGHTAGQALLIGKYEARYGAKSHKRRVMPDRHCACVGQEDHKLPGGQLMIRISTKHDPYHGAPWREYDGHGDVIESREKMEGYENWELYSKRWNYLYYDHKATLSRAIKEEWDAPPYRTGTRQEQAFRAMRADYERLRRWCNDDLWYVGLIVELYTLDDGEPGEPIAEESCWGFECDDMSNLTQQAREWAARMVKEYRQEVRETAYWAARDVATVEG